MPISCKETLPYIKIHLVNTKFPAIHIDDEPMGNIDLLVQMF